MSDGKRTPDEQIVTGDMVEDVRIMRDHYDDIATRLSQRPWSINMTAEDAFQMFVDDMDVLLDNYDNDDDPLEVTELDLTDEE